MFDPSYTAALNRLQAFVPKAGKCYAINRNYDATEHVSALSPYIRHRIITEEDVIRATLGRHSLSAAEKFIQEVYWRTYWKGWLEMRPSIWSSYKSDLNAALNRVQTESGLRQSWEAACKGETGIACFDHWANELTQTGYLHNHARMWFASIWVFTLQLPWVLGADFFMRHLLDGDPASNTLSWRWVSGQQTIGKTYLARPDNIAKYTQGRFHPTGLAEFSAPLDGPPHPPRAPLPVSDIIAPNKRTGLLITEEDMSVGWLLDQFTPVATAIVQTTHQRSPLMPAVHVQDFVASGLTDCGNRYRARLGQVEHITTEGLTRWMKEHNLEQVVTSYLPVGPTRDALSPYELRQMKRTYDDQAWPHATHGFFKFKDKIPKLIGQIQGLVTV